MTTPTPFDASPQLTTLPTTRVGYSDRAAWMMCEMSALAYLRFEGENRFDGILRTIGIAANAAKFRWGGAKASRQLELLRDDLKSYIAQQLAVANAGNAPDLKGLQDLKSSLDTANFKLVRPFNTNDTQAFLAKRDSDKTAVLSFRGTEANSLSDIKTDMNARFYEGGGGVKGHSGFINAYEQVRKEVQQAVKNLPDDFSLYITGHSLGGALAIVATRDLEGLVPNSLAACYTFGSPRVGNLEFGDDIHTPVYRVVNAADMVPRVPPTLTADFAAFGVSLFSKASGEWIWERFCGYLHQGDMRYLTACDDNLSSLKVIPNLPMYRRAKRLIKRVVGQCGPSVMASDHRVSEYQRKLKHYAERRINDSEREQNSGFEGQT